MIQTAGAERNSIPASLVIMPAEPLHEVIPPITEDIRPALIALDQHFERVVGNQIRQIMHPASASGSAAWQAQGPR
jgi:hypothetical protein